MTILEKTLATFVAKKTTENNDKDFDKIAIALLENSKIIAKDATFIVRECEIFMYHETHKDAFIHNKKYTFVDRQEQFGEWCFYHFKNPRLYPKHKHSGVELTFGNGTKMSAGILLKSVYFVEEDRLIEKANTIAQTFLEKIGIEELERIATETGKFAFDNASQLRIEDHELENPKPIFKGAREFKLSPKVKIHTDHTYVDSYYRYFNDKGYAKVK